MVINLKNFTKNITNYSLLNSYDRDKNKFNYSLKMQVKINIYNTFASEKYVLLNIIIKQVM